jgi:hypothetical protein
MTPPRLFHTQARALRGTLFHRRRPLFFASAPGWVDLFGEGLGDADYPAIGWPTADQAAVALQADPDPTLRVQLLGAAEAADLPLETLAPAGLPVEYSAARARLADLPPELALAASCWLALLREEFARPLGGARLLIAPHSGPGATASMAVAITAALCEAFAVRLARRELALCAYQGLRYALGYPLGPLGPLVAGCGTPGELLAIDGPRCGLIGLRLPADLSLGLRPAPGPTLPLPPELCADEGLRARLALTLLRELDGPQYAEHVRLIAALLGQAQAVLAEHGLAPPIDQPAARVAYAGAVVWIVGQ